MHDTLEGGSAGVTDLPLLLDGPAGSESLGSALHGRQVDVHVADQRLICKVKGNFFLSLAAQSFVCSVQITPGRNVTLSDVHVRAPQTPWWSQTCAVGLIVQCQLKENVSLHETQLTEIHSNISGCHCESTSSTSVRNFVHPHIQSVGTVELRACSSDKNIQ